jgi:hypothetical protein
MFLAWHILHAPPVPLASLHGTALPCVCTIDALRHLATPTAVDRGWMRQKRALTAAPSMPALLRTLREVAAGMAFLHANDILHCDLTGAQAPAVACSLHPCLPKLTLSMITLLAVMLMNWPGCKYDGIGCQQLLEMNCPADHQCKMDFLQATTCCWRLPPLRAATTAGSGRGWATLGWRAWRRGRSPQPPLGRAATCRQVGAARLRRGFAWPCCGNGVGYCKAALLLLPGGWGNNACSSC